MARQTPKPTSTWLPGVYLGTDAMDVVIRDPDSALVIWEITPESVAACRARLDHHWDKLSIVLRIQSVDRRRKRPARTLDIPLERWNGARYVPLGDEGASHIFSIGLKSTARTQEPERGDIFAALARFGPLQSPRALPNDDDSAPYWAIAPDKEGQR